MPNFDSHGNLETGVHLCSWEEFEERFGYNFYRKRQIRGMRDALDILKNAGCPRVFIDGSFVTEKRKPGDYDACWDTAGVDFGFLDVPIYPIKRKKEQIQRFRGEWLPANMRINFGITVLEFFQRDRMGNSKGIVEINLGDYR